MDFCKTDTLINPVLPAYPASTQVGSGALAKGKVLGRKWPTAPCPFTWPAVSGEVRADGERAAPGPGAPPAEGARPGIPDESPPAHGHVGKGRGHAVYKGAVSLTVT